MSGYVGIAISTGVNNTLNKTANNPDTAEGFGT